MNNSKFDRLYGVWSLIFMIGIIILGAMFRIWKLNNSFNNTMRKKDQERVMKAARRTHERRARRQLDKYQTGTWIRKISGSKNESRWQICHEAILNDTGDATFTCRREDGGEFKEILGDEIALDYEVIPAPEAASKKATK